MNTNFQIAGIAFIAAAIIGGGLEAFGIKVPLLNSMKRQVILGLFGAGLLIAAVISSGRTPESNTKPGELPGAPKETDRSTAQPTDPPGKPSTEPTVRIRVNPVDGLGYVFISPGAFMMGCPRDCDPREQPSHAEQVAEGFWLTQTKVTQAAWVRVVKGDNPSRSIGDQLPVENVSWFQARDYCTTVGGRLPSEKEWEYAARAGVAGPSYGPPDDIAWHDDNSGGTTHPVGLKQPNAFGLYDMLGNAFEWTSDDFQPGLKVVRGNSYGVYPDRMHVSSRFGHEPSLVRPAPFSNGIGLRCVVEFR